MFQIPRLWLQFLIFALAVALELSLVLNELVAVLIGWRGFHLGRRNATWMVCHFLATGRGSWCKHGIHTLEKHTCIIYIYMYIDTTKLEDIMVLSIRYIKINIHTMYCI